VPADRCPLEPLWLALGKQVAVVECVGDAQFLQFAGGGLGLDEVPALDSTAEPGVWSAVRGYA
jgi:hypothetical protein